MSRPPGTDPAEGMLDHLMELCDMAGDGLTAADSRRAVVETAARVPCLESGLLVAVEPSGARVLASTRPGTAEGVEIPEEVVAAASRGVASGRLGGGERVALTRVAGRWEPPLLVGGLLSDEPSAEDERVLRSLAIAAGAALRIADERHTGDRARITAERLIEAGMAMASHLSIDEVLNRLVTVAREVLGARYAALGVLNPAHTELERFVTSGLTPEEMQTIGAPPRGKGILGILIREPRPVRIPEMAADPRSFGFPPGHPPMKSFLGVPIVLRGEVFGNLYVTEKETADEFSEEDERLAQTLAAQAAVAVDNARRYESERLRVGELRSVQEVARAILSTLDLEELLPLIARRARRLTGADTVGIALGGDGPMRFRIAHGVDALAMESVDSPGDLEEVADALCTALGASTAVVEPLEVDGDRVGALAAVARTPMDARARRLLATLASQASIAVANAETFAAERRRLRESAQVQAAEARASAAAEGLRQAIEAQEAERARVARELHDEAGQSLTALALNLRMLDEHVDAEGQRRLAELRQMVNGISGSLRNLATDLRPSGLREHGLSSAIERQAARLREATGMAVDVLVNDLPDDLPEEMQIALFRVVQEALTNVARHSGAGQASVVVSRHGGHIRVVVEDDGRGFDTAGPSNRLGIPGIRERVELIGGSLRIESALGAGTALIVDLEDPR